MALPLSRDFKNCLNFIFEKLKTESNNLLRKSVGYLTGT